MKYEKIVQAKFIERANRFVARVELVDDCPGGTGFTDAAGQVVKVHVKNTGRCRELLVPGATVYLEDFEGRMGSRRMRYSLVAVEKKIDCKPVVDYDAEKGNGDPVGGDSVHKGDGLQNARREDGKGRGVLLINMDSQAPNRVVQEALEDGRIVLPGLMDPPSTEEKCPEAPGSETPGAGKPLPGTKPLAVIKPEAGYGNSRFDFYVERAATATDAVRRAFIEVKGVTLEQDGHARFPDAPTERGVKHINELISARREGYLAYIIFVVQMEGVRDVAPNDDTHPQFGEALAKAAEAGVEILAYDCTVTPDSLAIRKPIKFIHNPVANKGQNR